jgi:hypothetical protein
MADDGDDEELIGLLRAGKAANFHKLDTELSNAAIEEFFREVRKRQESRKQNLMYHCRERHRDAIWSAISFRYLSHPPFLDESSKVKDLVAGYMLLVEYRDYLAVFKSRLEMPPYFPTKYLGRVPAERIASATARGEPIFEKIRLRHMSVSKNAMRNKTLEADDLRNAVPQGSSNRYAPQGYTLRTGTDQFSATPRTGRITQRSDRVDHTTLIDYACVIIDQLIDAPNEVTPFLRAFARPVDLESIKGRVRPTTIAIDVAGLADTIFEHRQIRLVRKKGKGFTELKEDETREVLNHLTEIFEIRGEGSPLKIFRHGEEEPIGAISINKSRIALRELQLASTVGLEVESTAYDVGEDPDRMSLRHYLNAEDAFILLFNELSYAYIDGALFEDSAFTDGGGNFLRYLRTDPLLSDVTDEKGTFSRTHTEFDPDSTFGVIANSTADGDNILVCDDLGDEWADFIGLDTGSSPKRLTFYHGKHGALSLGASPFHVSVSQALKNLGNMNLLTTAIDGKIDNKWAKNYVSGSSVRTRISRIVRGDPHRLASDFEGARTAPDLTRRVFIVTSSLSRQSVEAAFAEIAAGNAPDPYFAQLYWLLMTFFSQCTEIGAHGYIMCQP